MSLSLDREISQLKKGLLSVCAMVEGNVQRAVQAIDTDGIRLANIVIERDAEIDEIEVHVEEDCLKILAMQQPVATDLRFIVAVLKINSDLERTGNEAMSIAEHVLALAARTETMPAIDFLAMAGKAEAMLQLSIDALVYWDSDQAEQVCMADDEIKMLAQRITHKIHQAIKKDPQCVESCIHLLAIARHLERIADYATNIGEDVLYMIRGEIVRHKRGHLAESPASQVALLW